MPFFLGLTGIQIAVAQVYEVSKKCIQLSLLPSNCEPAQFNQTVTEM